MSAINFLSTTEPFLRWAGGKRWLKKHLIELLDGVKFKNYHEPFLGGAAVFLSMINSKNSFLSDINQELINTYIAIKSNPYGVISILRNYVNSKDFYYEVRSLHYSDITHQAARFIYLNQTSFNGLYRVNLKGEYNVPYGYRNKNFIEEEKLVLVSNKLKYATITCEDFFSCIDNIHRGDLVFLDPPYTVSHNNNGFIKYNQDLFSLYDQIRLGTFIDKIKSKGAYYILTNAAHETIYRIFDKGDHVYLLNRASLIGGDQAKRGQTEEYVFTNLK